MPADEHRVASGSRWVLVVNVLAAVVAIGAFLVRVGRSLDKADWGYAAAEWLTNYDAGVVRRGLGGQLIDGVPWLDQRETLLVVVTTLFVAVVALQAMAVGLSVARLGNAWPLLVWLLPAGPLLANLQPAWQPMPAFANQFMFRKEYLGYLLLLAVAVVLLRWPGLLQHHRMAAAIVVGVGFGLAAFVHEALMLPAAAAVAMLFVFISPGSPVRRALSAALVLGPPILVAAGFVLAGPLRPGSADTIAAGLDPATQVWLGGPDAIRNSSPYYWLEQGTAVGIGFTQDAVINSGAWRGWLVIGLLAAGFVVVAASLADARRVTAGDRVAAGLVIVVVTAPLFVLGADTGRWLSVLGFLTLNTALVISAGRHTVGGPVGARSRLLAVVALVLIALTLAAGLPETGDPAGLLLGRR